MQGLFKRPNYETLGAFSMVEVHMDSSTIEKQIVCTAIARRQSTWRPIPTEVANAHQIIIVVVTQGGQIEVIACVSCGWNSWIDTTASVSVGLSSCT